MTTALIMVSDLHINSTVGLCPRSVNLDDKGTYSPNKTQRWMYGYWLECWQEMKEFTAQAKSKVLLINGDAVDNDHKNRSSQYITGNEATILKMAVQVLEPGLSLVDKALLIRGTDAHTGKDASMEEILANDIDIAVRDNDNLSAQDKELGKQGPASWWNYRGTLGGMRVDFTHHTTMGGLAWTAMNAANKVAIDAITQYTLMGQKYPDLAVRGHVHLHADSHDNYPCRAVILPAWQSMTGYGAKLNPNRLSDIGMIAFLIEHGEIVAEKKLITKLAQTVRSVWTNQL